MPMYHEEFGKGPVKISLTFNDRMPNVTEKMRVAQRASIGYLAYEMQELAKELAHVITGRMMGAIAVASPGEDIAVGPQDEPREYGVPNVDAAIGKVSPWGRRGYAIADVVVGAFAPYSGVEEFLRQHRFMSPAFDYIQSGGAKKEAQEFGRAKADWS